MKFILTLIAIGFIALANAQKTEEAKIGKWTAYLELAGTGVQFYTVNAEYLLGKAGRFNVNARGGFGMGTFKSREGYSGPTMQQDLNFLAIPVGLSAYNFVASNHHFETGLVVEYVQGTYVDVFEDQNSTILLTPSFGYRFQKPSGGIIFKILYTPNVPIHEFNRIKFRYPPFKTHHNVGLSLGYSFKRQK